MVGGAFIILSLYFFSWLFFTNDDDDISHSTGLVLGTAVFMVASFLVYHWIKELLIKLDKQR